MHKLLLCLQTLLSCCSPTQQEITPTTQSHTPTNIRITPNQQEELLLNHYQTLSDNNEPEIIDLSSDQRIIGTRVRYVPDWVLHCLLLQEENTNPEFNKQEIAIYLDDDIMNSFFIKILNDKTTYEELGYITKKLHYVISSRSSPDLWLDSNQSENFKKITQIICDYDRYHHTTHLVLQKDSLTYRPVNAEDNPYVYFKNTPWADKFIEKNNLQERYSFYHPYTINTCTYCHAFFECFNEKLNDSRYCKKNNSAQELPTELTLNNIDGILFTDTSGATSLVLTDLAYQDKINKDFYIFYRTDLIHLPAHRNLKPITIKKEFRYPSLFFPKNICTQAIRHENKLSDASFTFQETTKKQYPQEEI